MKIPNDPLEAFFELPQEIQDWHEADIVREQMRLGIDPDWSAFWYGLTRSQQWQLIADLLDLSLPKEMPCPRVTLAKRAAPLKVSSFNNASCVPAPNQSPDPTHTDNVKQVLLTWQNVRLIGMRGSGKTSKARWICQNRIAKGEKVYWVNPHLEYADKMLLQSLGVTIIGGGRDYQAIAAFCTQFCEGDNSTLTKEYERYNNEPNAKFQPETIVLDELTNYKEQVGQPILTFVKASIQEFSKINRSTIYITHNKTLSCMGAPDGFAGAITSNLFDLALEANPLEGNRVPKAIAKYRMPNSDSWLDVTIPVEWQ